jgi:hypothetical protein
VDDPYEALRHAIAHLRAQLAFLPRDDPDRDQLYRNLLWCYHEAFALLERRIMARRASSDRPAGQQTDRTAGVKHILPSNLQPYAHRTGVSCLVPIAPLYDT